MIWRKFLHLFCLAISFHILSNIALNSMVLSQESTCAVASPEKVSRSAAEEPVREIWLINSRTASKTRPTEQELQKLAVYRWEKNPSTNRCRWDRTDFEHFSSIIGDSDQKKRTVVLVHGNHFSLQDASNTGLLFDRLILHDTDSRLVIWAWSADEIPGGIRYDVQTKGRFSEYQGEYIAEILKRFPENSQVSLVGFSFGARTICEGIERWVKKQSSSAPGTFTLALRNLFLAPAVDQASLLPKCKYGQVAGASEKTLILFNPRDRALRLYPMINQWHGGPQALGRFGLSPACFPQELRKKIESMNITRISGNRHEFHAYFDSPRINQELTDFVLFREKQETK